MSTWSTTRRFTMKKAGHERSTGDTNPWTLVGVLVVV
jgi:hypothetical protein